MSANEALESFWRDSCCIWKVSIRSFLNSGIMKKPSCQDILRHVSPFRRGRMSLFDCAVGSLNAATMPPALQPNECSVLPQLRGTSFPSPIILSSIPIFKTPQLGQLSSLYLFPQLRDSAFFWYWSTNSTTGPTYPGQQVQWARTPHSAHHCVLPLANARTRCRLMASSRNPATFSLSSCRLKEHVYIPPNKQ